MRRIREKIICFIIMPLIITGSILIDKQLPHKAEEIKSFEPDLSVETMYLTVFKGSSENNTDHTWEEINTYSKYDYEEMGTENYQTEALLQSGDENSSLPGISDRGQTKPNATVRMRGNTSSKAAQKSYQIRLTNEEDHWNGQKIINLNKHLIDGFRFSNKMLYDIMYEIPQIISLNTKFIHLYVKDAAGGKSEFEDYGLYTHVEQINKNWLEAHDLDKYGYLYKETVLFEFYRYEDDIRSLDDPMYDEKKFSQHLKTKGSNDHGKIIKMLEELNYSGNSSKKTIKKYFDTENIAYWMAFMLLTDNTRDTEAHNLFLYSPRNKKTWYLIPWDNDGCFWDYRHDVRNTRQGVNNYWSNSLFQRCLMLPEFRKELDKAVNELYENYFEKENFRQRTKKYGDIVKPYIYQMPDSEYAVYSEEKFDIMVDNLYSAIEENYTAYTQSLKSPMPFFTGVPQKTDDGLKINWNSSYNFDGGEITYDVKISDTPSFENIIAEDPEAKQDNFNKQPGIVLPVTLSPGKYFLSVTARNEAGFSQSSFETYTENGQTYNAVCFNVLQDGTITSGV